METINRGVGRTYANSYILFLFCFPDRFQKHISLSSTKRPLQYLRFNYKYLENLSTVHNTGV